MMEGGAMERKGSERQADGGLTRHQGAGDGVREQTDGPRKQHGDALEEGTGTRHGVQERTERPRTGDEEKPNHGA
jgi:hypothetical protein